MDEQESRELQSSDPTRPALPMTEELEKLLDLAKQGNADAQYRLGQMCCDGEVLPKDYGGAVHWFRQAAQRGHASAQVDLGTMYYDGSGVTQSYDEAVKWYSKAAEQGDADGQYSLGCMYEWGHGVTLDYDEAIKWYQLAAENGDQEAEMAIDRIEAAKNLKEYSRNGQPAYYDPIRGVLTLKTPEETVRQEFLYTLLNKFQVQPDAIEVECPLSDLGLKSKQRADIIIFNNETPIMVIECKAPNTPLVDDVFEQCADYAAELGCRLLAITNGDYTQAYHYVNDEWLEIDAFPSFGEMLRPYKLKYVPHEDRRMEPLTYDQICDPRFLFEFNNRLSEEKDLNILGEDTPEYLWPHIANLFNAIYTSKNIGAQFPSKYYDIEIAEFLDYKYTVYKNAGGGEYDGLYAGFRVVDSGRNHQIYRIGFFATGHHEDDPRWGNRKGTSGIYVAIDNFDMKPHLSLELAFDTYMDVAENSFSVNHNGRITVGNLGAAKRDLMIKYVKL